MKSWIVASLIGLTSLSFSACSKNVSDTASCSTGTQVDAVCFQVSDQRNLIFSNGVLSGLGSAVAINPLADSRDSGRNITATFSLQEGGSLVFKTFSKNDLSSGVDIKLSRISSKLNLSFVQGETVSASKELAGVDSSAEIKLILDVHNDESPAHIVIWNGAESFKKDQPLFDSEEPNSVQPAGNGMDKFWGVSLDKSSLSKVALGEPKDDE